MGSGNVGRGIDQLVTHIVEILGKNLGDGNIEAHCSNVQCLAAHFRRFTGKDLRRFDWRHADDFILHLLHQVELIERIIDEIEIAQFFRFERFVLRDERFFEKAIEFLLINLELLTRILPHDFVSCDFRRTPVDTAKHHVEYHVDNHRD